MPQIQLSTPAVWVQLGIAPLQAQLLSYDSLVTLAAAPLGDTPTQGDATLSAYTQVQPFTAPDLVVWGMLAVGRMPATLLVSPQGVGVTPADLQAVADAAGAAQTAADAATADAADALAAAQAAQTTATAAGTLAASKESPVTTNPATSGRAFANTDHGKKTPLTGGGTMTLPGGLTDPAGGHDWWATVFGAGAVSWSGGVVVLKGRDGSAATSPLTIPAGIWTVVQMGESSYIINGV